MAERAHGQHENAEVTVDGAISLAIKRHSHNGQENSKHDESLHMV